MISGVCLQQAQKREEATLDEKIGALAAMKEGLVAKKFALEKQIADVEARQERKRVEEGTRAGNAKRS
jgi:hypothetical protein